MSKMNAGYEITEHINIGNDHYVLGHNPKAPAPYVTWATNEAQDYFTYGHYFTGREDALSDLLRRATESLELNGKPAVMSLISDDVRSAIQREYREDCARGDIESALLYVIDRDRAPYDPQALMQDPVFMTKAMRLYDNIDHSYENEAIADNIRDLLDEQDFSHCVPKNPVQTLNAVVKISPEMTDLLNALLSTPSAKIPETYGPLGDNFQFEFSFPNGMKGCLELAPYFDRVTGELSETETPGLVIEVRDSDGFKIYSDTALEFLASSITAESYEARIGDTVLIMDLQSDESLRRTGNQFTYQSNTDDARYANHNGEVCKVLRPLTPQECDILITGLMWEAEFPNGDVIHVFDEELTMPEKAKELRPGLDSMIHSAETRVNPPAQQTKPKEPEL